MQILTLFTREYSEYHVYHDIVKNIIGGSMFAKWINKLLIKNIPLLVLYFPCCGRRGRARSDQMSKHLAQSKLENPLATSPIRTNLGSIPSISPVYARRDPVRDTLQHSPKRTQSYGYWIDPERSHVNGRLITSLGSIPAWIDSV